MHSMSGYVRHSAEDVRRSIGPFNTSALYTKELHMPSFRGHDPNNYLDWTPSHPTVTGIRSDSF